MLQLAVAARPGQLGDAVGELDRHLGTEVPGHPLPVLTAAGQGVGDGEPRHGAVEHDLAVVAQGGVEPRVRRVVGRPHLPPARARSAPSTTASACSAHMNGPASCGLVLAVDLDGVVGAGRAEVAPPLGLAVVAVRARVDEELDAVVPHLDRQGVGVAVRRDGEEAVGPAVAAAPDLGPLAAVTCAGGAGRRRRNARGATCGRSVPRRRRAEAPSSGAHAPRGAPEATSRRPPRVLAPQASRTAQGSSSGSSSDEGAALVAVALPRRAARWRRGWRRRRRGSGRAATRVASASGCPAASASTRADEAELGDEAVVVGGELAVDAAREGVGGELALQARGTRRGASPRSPRTTGRRRPPRAVRPPRRSRGCSPTSPRLRNAARCSWCQRSWARASRVVLEEVGDARPVVEQPADPHPARQPDAELDPARPVDAGQERVRAATTSAAGPRRPRRSGRRCVSHQAAARTVRWWWRESSHTDLTLPVTVSSRWSMRNASAASGARRAGDRVAEPVGVHDVGSRRAEHLPVAGEQPVGGGDDPTRGLGRHLRPGLRARPGCANARAG